MRLFLKKHEKYINRVLTALFVIALFFAIRETDYPLLIKGRIPELLFCHNGNSDAILGGIVTGYITGYFVYVLTVLLPNAIKYSPINEDVISQLRDIYSRSVLTLLIMYKSVCTEEEWKGTSGKSDLDCLGEDFFEKIKRFDLYAEAYSLYMHKDEKRRLKWHEYLREECSAIQVKVTDLFSAYSMYLDYNTVDILLRYKNSHFLGMMTGNDQDSESVLRGADGYTYFDAISISMYYEATSKGSPFFANKINRDRLAEYVEILKEIKALITGSGSENSENRQISKLQDSKAGKLESAVFVFPASENNQGYVDDNQSNKGKAE